MALPYMGSKRKSASKIVNIIEAYCPDNNKQVIELFTWGFAIWEKFLSKGYDVIANDKNKYVIALLDVIINWKLDKEKCIEWVSKKLFKDIIENPWNYEDWYVGYVMCIWSFWNNQKGYLFWPDNEIKKKSLFELVVNKKADDFVRDLMPKKYIDWICKQENWHKRRMALKKVLWVMKKNDVRLQNIESLERLQAIQSLSRLQSLESLQSLERLESLEKVKFINKSYEDVEIPKEAIVYCDPPYKGTATYAEWWFNHKEFWQYVRELSKTNKVFISEYKAPDDFKAIYEFSQKSSLAWWVQSHNNQPNECLFIYENT